MPDLTAREKDVIIAEQLFGWEWRKLGDEMGQWVALRPPKLNAPLAERPADVLNAEIWNVPNFSESDKHCRAMRNRLLALREHERFVAALIQLLGLPHIEGASMLFYLINATPAQQVDAALEAIASKPN